MIDLREFNLKACPTSPRQAPRLARPLWMCLLAGGAWLAFAVWGTYLAIAWRSLTPAVVR